MKKEHRGGYRENSGLPVGASGHKYITFDKKNRVYRVRTNIKGKYTDYGSFHTLESAIEAKKKIKNGH